MSDYITVRVGRVPGAIQDVTLEAGATTVADALDQTDLDADGYEIRVNSQPKTEEFGLSDGDTVLLVKKIKGN